MEKRDTVIVLTTGKEDRGARAVLALSWACTALAMGQSVGVFLTMDGAVWARRDACYGVNVAGFEPLHNYLEQFLALGGVWQVCAPCTEYYCGAPQGDTTSSLHPDVDVIGLATLLSTIGPNSSVVSF
jgi:predicted peroxiredoxin